MKRFFATLLSLLMVLSLVACGSNTAPATSTEPVASTEPSASTQSPASSEPILIGMYGPLSGSSASVGTSGQAGVKLAIKQINAAGGINGRQIQLVEYDDQQNTETSVKVVTRLVQQDKVTAIIGSHISGSILATTDITEDAKIIQMGAGTSPIWTNIGLKYTFRGTARSNLFNVATYDAMKKLGATKIATIGAETEYAQTGVDTFVKMIKDENVMQVVDQEGYTSGDTDFSGQIVKMMAAKADGVLLYGGGEDMGKIVKQLRQKGYTGYIYGVESLADRQVKEIAGDSANGVIFSCCYYVPDSVEEATSEAEKTFLEAFKGEYGELPVSEVAYRDYDGMNILAEAMKNASELTGDGIREALLKLKYTGIGGEFDFSDESGDGISSSRTFIIDGGKTKLLDDYIKNK
jgi:branched-chain amino acid transport system substrate-binding protein